MRKLTFLISSLLIGSAFAQNIPTLTQATAVPLIGTSYELYTSSSALLNVAQGGANQVWDFSEVSGSTVVVNYSSDANSSNPGVFPNCNLAEESSMVENYINTTSSSYSFVGQISQGVQIEYTDMAEVLKFPMTYGDQFTETLAGETEIPFIGSVQGGGTSEINADGHGELITSYGTISNVLRVHVTQELNLSVIGLVTNDLYLWYDANNKVPLAQYTIFNAPGAGQYVEVASVLTQTDLDPGTTITSVASILKSNLKVFPNPVKNELNILEAEIGKQVTILSVSGQVLKTQTIKNTTEQINVSNLPQGLYMIKVDNSISQFVKTE